MKTFEQFLSEAQRPAFASQRDIRGAERHLKSPEASQTREHPVIARRRAKEEAQRTGQRGTSVFLAQQDIARQLAAQKAAQETQERSRTARQKPPSQPIEPKQLEMRFMRTDKPHIPLSLDGRLIPKTQKLPKPAKKVKQPKPKTRQLRIPKT